MKQLVDDGKVVRLYNGVYYLAYITILGTKGRVCVDKFLKKKYIAPNGAISGYITGIQLANMYGFTTQNPACIEISFFPDRVYRNIYQGGLMNELV